MRQKLVDMWQNYSRYRHNSENHEVPVCLNDGKPLHSLFIILEPLQEDLEELIKGKSSDLITIGGAIFQCAECEMYLATRYKRSMISDLQDESVKGIFHLEPGYSTNEYRVREVPSISSSQKNAI